MGDGFNFPILEQDAHNPGDLGKDTTLNSVTTKSLTVTGATTVAGGTATGAAGAATLNAQAGVVTTESLTTAGGAKTTYTITNSFVTASSRVLVAVQHGTNTTRPIVATNPVPAAGSFTVDLENLTASTAANGTLLIHFLVA